MTCVASWLCASRQGPTLGSTRTIPGPSRASPGAAPSRRFDGPPRRPQQACARYRRHLDRLRACRTRTGCERAIGCAKLIGFIGNGSGPDRPRDGILPRIAVSGAVADQCTADGSPVADRAVPARPMMVLRPSLVQPGLYHGQATLYGSHPVAQTIDLVADRAYVAAHRPNSATITPSSVAPTVSVAISSPVTSRPPDALACRATYVEGMGYKPASCSVVSVYGVRAWPWAAEVEPATGSAVID